MKMKYLINNEIHFDSEEKTLKLATDDHRLIELKAGAMANLFEVLIEHNGQTITKEELYKLVWEDHGYKASASNLNKTISLLRKAIRDIGYDAELIATYPRQGLCFSAEVKKQSLSPESQGTQYHHNVKKKNKITTPIHIAIAIAIAIAVIVFAALQQKSHTEKTTTQNNTMKIDKCTFLFLERESPTFKESKVNELKNNINCTKDEVTFVYTAPMTNKNESTRNLEFTATCHDNGIKKCKNTLTIKK